MAEYIYGKNAVRQRIKSQKAIQKLYLNQERPDSEIMNLAKANEIELELVHASFFKRFEGKHQHIAASVEAYQYLDLDAFLKNCPEEACVIIADRIEDPHNIGAILRSMDAFGMDALILPKHGSVSLNATVAKVSTGAIETVPCIQVTNLSQCIDKLKEHGFWVYGSEVHPKSVDYRSLSYQGKIALVIGSEGKGISRLVLEHCDQLIQIPMRGEVNSLNASVSAALLMAMVHHQRFPL